MTLPIIITPGEPAGIGPDVVIQLAQRECAKPLVVVADPDLLSARAKLLGLELKLNEFSGQEKLHTPGELFIIPEKLKAEVIPGQLNVENAPYVLSCLDKAIEGCLQNKFVGLVTGPVHKGVINDSGIAFTGHTEYLAQKANVPLTVMMLANQKMHVALATTHLPLREVAQTITKNYLEQVLRILHANCHSRTRSGSSTGSGGNLASKDPVIYVCGLNPHAGEGGHLGKEDVDIIFPVIKKLKAEGMHLVGPLPADTIFSPGNLKKADVFLAMYHDQGLPVVKYSGFKETVNITLGLPFQRVSVDHGTALPLAGTGKASMGSLLAAVDVLC